MPQEEKKKQTALNSTGEESGTAEDISSLTKQLGERSFSWSPEEDELYKLYADRYRQQGKIAMKDTIGTGTALTGGYSSSYAQAAGQQAYDSYLQKLNDAGLELYDRAYQRYGDEGEALQDRLENLQQQDETAYDRSQDEKDRQNTAYNNLYKLILNSGYIPTDEEIGSVNMTRAAAQALREAYLSGLKSGGSSGSGSSGGKTGTSGGSSGSGNIYSALLAELKALSTAGSGRETAAKRITAAFNAGRITQNQRDYLMRSFA